MPEENDYWFRETMGKLTDIQQDLKDNLVAHDVRSGELMGRLGDQHTQIISEVNSVRKDYNKFFLVVLIIMAVGVVGVKSLPFIIELLL